MKVRGRKGILIVFLLMIGFLLPHESWGAKKQVKTVPKAGDCQACHKDKKVLPENHPATADMNWKGCLMCHPSGEKGLVGKIPGSHRHQLSGVSCVSCHGKVKKEEPVKMAKCVSCHGDPAKLAEKTAGVKPTNPHTSPHYGTELDCNLCHHQHVKSENYCLQCHSFPFRVP
ncbi:MAG TPA: cytochrome c3 family protein [Syntrophales bacterium]|nr:cytochrome c3 family protein [Syntrophales bacterium]HOL58448.1 cytochrome c3 family protein [Syntrophales bacterium]HPO34617.1 cytochrome c3 family protein [Syntrophales bacterium]